MQILNYLHALSATILLQLLIGALISASSSLNFSPRTSVSFEISEQLVLLVWLLCKQPLMMAVRAIRYTPTCLSGSDPLYTAAQRAPPKGRVLIVHPGEQGSLLPIYSSHPPSCFLGSLPKMNKPSFRPPIPYQPLIIKWVVFRKSKEMWTKELCSSWKLFSKAPWAALKISWFCLQSQGAWLSWRI